MVQLLTIYAVQAKLYPKTLNNTHASGKGKMIVMYYISNLRKPYECLCVPTIISLSFPA